MRAWGWGAGTSGQLGSGQLTDALLPTKVVHPLLPLIHVACGGNHAIALSGHDVFAWGFAKASGSSSMRGEAIPLLAIPTKVPASLFAQQQICSVSAGWSHTAFVAGSGTIFMAGDGAFGQLGLGQAVTSANRPTPVMGRLTACKVIDAACGMHHTVVMVQTPAQTHSGLDLPVAPTLATPANTSIQVYAFGANRHGQAGATGGASTHSTCLLAPPSTNSPEVLSPDTKTGVQKPYEACGPASERSTPAKVWEPGLVPGMGHKSAVCKVYAAGHHSAALDSTGCLYLWGRSYISQADCAHPLPVAAPAAAAVGVLTSHLCGHLCHHSKYKSGIARWTQVSLGWSHALGLDDEGTVWAWGSNRYGQCGQPHAEQPNVVRESAEVLRSQQSPLDFGATLPLTATVNEPTRVQSLETREVVCISAGAEHSVAVTSHGGVFAWGWGEHGQLGLGTTLNAFQATQVDVSACTQVACGSGFTITTHKA